MAIRAERVLYPKFPVLRNTFNDSNIKTAKPKSKNLGKPEALPAVSANKRINPPIQEKEAYVIDLDELIGELQSVSNEKLRNKFGFHRSEISEEEKILGNKAKKISEVLIQQYENPNEQVVKYALGFLKSLNLIEELNELTKERGSNFGFRNTKSDEDKILAKRANDFSALLVANTIEKEIIAVIKFLEVVKIIEALEVVVKEKLDRGPFGIIQKPPPAKQDLEIGEQALKFANRLKIKLDTPALQAAIVFLALSRLDPVKSL